MLPKQNFAICSTIMQNWLIVRHIMSFYLASSKINFLPPVGFLPKKAQNVTSLIPPITPLSANLSTPRGGHMAQVIGTQANRLPPPTYLPLPSHWSCVVYFSHGLWLIVRPLPPNAPELAFKLNHQQLYVKK